MIELFTPELAQSAADMSQWFSTLGLPALISTIIVGLFGFWTKKAENRRPDLVSDSYATLVNNLENQVNALLGRMQQLEADRDDDHLMIEQLKRDRSEQAATIYGLNQRVQWMLQKLNQLDREEFYSVFGDEGMAGPRHHDTL